MDNSQLTRHAGNAKSITTCVHTSSISSSPQKTQSQLHRQHISRIQKLAGACIPAKVTTSWAGTSFENIPPELREMCFMPLMEWDGRTPPIIRALERHGEGLEYEELLVLFHCRNVYVLNKANKWKVSPPNSVARMRNIKIEVE